MSAKYESTANLKRLRYHLKQYPRLQKQAMDAGTRRHAEGILNTLVTGIQKNNLGMKRLTGFTEMIKRSWGYRRVKTILMATGEVAEDGEGPQTQERLAYGSVRTTRSLRNARAKTLGCP